MKRLLAAVALITPLLLYILASRSIDCGLRPGDRLPAARLQLLDGTPVETTSWRGTPTLLVLFLPGCRSCAEEIRGLVQIAPQLQQVRIVLLSMNGEPPAEEVPFMVCRDAGGEFVKRTRRFMVPALYWIDRSGRVAYARAGLRTPSSDLRLFEQLRAKAEEGAIGAGFRPYGQDHAAQRN